MEFAAFLIPATLFAEFTIIGRLFFPEALLLLALPWLILRQRNSPAWSSWLLALASLGALWLAGQVATDVIRETPFSDYSRGWAKIVFTISNLVAITLLVAGSRRRAVLFAAGLSVGWFVQFAVNPNVYAAFDIWKFGLSFPTTMLIVLAASTPRLVSARWVSALLVGAMAALNLVSGSRSLGGVCALTAMYLLLQWFATRRLTRPSKSSLTQVLIFCVVAFVGVLGILQAYAYAADQGFLGTDARDKYLAQASGDFGILLGGRTALLVSLQAVSDSPLIGHGSWAKDFAYVDLLIDRLSALGYESVIVWVDTSGLIPAHSYLLGAWIEAGLLGAVFWAVVYVIPLRTLGRQYLLREPLTPLVVLCAFQLLWDVPFAPYGAEQRLTLPFYLVVLLLARQLTAPDTMSKTSAPQPAAA